MEKKQEERPVHIVLLPVDFERIEHIRKHCGLTSMREVIRKAVAVLNVIVEEEATLYAKDKETKIVIV